MNDKIELLRNTVNWLVVILYLAGFFVVFSWPRVKGKYWILFSLALLFVQGAHFRYFEHLVYGKGDRPDFDLIERYKPFNTAVYSLVLLAYAMLVVGLFRLRMMLASNRFRELMHADLDAIPTAIVKKQWRVSGSTWSGAFRVRYSNTIQLARKSSLTWYDNNHILLGSHYDPPGSGVLALLATILTSYIVAILSQTMGFFMGPGYLIWFIVFVFIRRRAVVIDLSKVDVIVVDSDTNRIAFRRKFDGRNRWYGLEFSPDGKDALDAITSLFPEKVEFDSVTRISKRASTIMLSAIIIIAAVVIYFSIKRF